MAGRGAKSGSRCLPCRSEFDEVDDYRQTSLEWRFSGSADSLFGLEQSVEFIAGAYYFQSDFNIIADIARGSGHRLLPGHQGLRKMLTGSLDVPGNPLGGLLGGLVPPLTDLIIETDYYRFDYFQDTEAVALFGGSWGITDKWVLTPGLRYNSETKKSTPTGTAVCTERATACLTATLVGGQDYTGHHYAKRASCHPSCRSAVPHRCHFLLRRRLHGFQSGGRKRHLPPAKAWNTSRSRRAPSSWGCAANCWTTPSNLTPPCTAWISTT